MVSTTTSHKVSKHDQRPEANGFPTTRWTLLRAAGEEGDSEGAAAAVESLCLAYWKPLNRYVRAWGFGNEDSADLTQGFLAGFVEGGRLQTADRDKGKLRTLLLTSIKR